MRTNDIANIRSTAPTRLTFCSRRHGVICSNSKTLSSNCYCFITRKYRVSQKKPDSYDILEQLYQNRAIINDFWQRG